MKSIWPELLGRQMAAAIQMLRAAVESCPEELWDDRREGTPFWHVAYHALFYADLYLTESVEKFEAPAFHVDKANFLPGDYGEYGGVVRTAEAALSRARLLEYADQCLQKSDAVFANLTEERALERCGFPWYELNVGEFLLNNLRHTQHHAGQLALVLRRGAGKGVEWFGSRDNAPPERTW